MNTGVVLSARSYSSNGNFNYNYYVKSMIISSGVNPMAYVLSDYKDSQGCLGQHFFKFDPTSISVHPSAWIKKTIGSFAVNCGHMGLTFGRGESFLYAFSFYYNTISDYVVTLLDTNGNSIW